ncbi:aminotransferase [Virgibacillus phasianinus]|uniref:Aminotransferase n=1 Tax=Virgibacillus phasianinus TaxID=2017483 RepID=A0A220TYM7_9BACI|nr:aminotransferase class V-fold PLP-dependent enzyme [Virgibacillus phasianinus]ASK60773.1 aminotransferase [Virgibacillus phasianinus]
MKHTTSILYKIADDVEELEQIHSLNYQTFVKEIPQHHANKTGKLIDRFNDENTYIVAKRNEEVIGMIAVRGHRPFSLDQKLENLDSYLPENAVPCEVRLLSVKEAFRGGRVFYGLCEQLVSYCLEKGYTMALISGTTRQAKLYKHLGFLHFGPLVGTKEAPYQPMYLTKKNFELASRVFQRLLKRKEKPFYHNFLPGPVEVTKKVREAWQKPAISHRSTTLLNVVRDIQSKLGKLVNANHVELAVGTGTLANDMVAAHLSSLPGRGLILANGEFGERLKDHGRRWNLSFAMVHNPWNTSISIEEVDRALKDDPDIRWLWAVHCETSTGYVSPLKQLTEVCQKYQVHLCLDACSSIGVLPVDLSDVYLATAVSGKGLASYPGLALVFHQESMMPNAQVPNYLDIGTYQVYDSVPYTHSSNGLMALQAALSNPQPTRESLAEEICHTFMEAGMDVLRGNNYSPGIITVQLPEEIDSRVFGDRLKSAGVYTSYESAYLLKRNWFQVALMGEQNQPSANKAIQLITKLFNQLHKEKEMNT